MNVAELVAKVPLLARIVRRNPGPRAVEFHGALRDLVAAGLEDAAIELEQERTRVQWDERFDPVLWLRKHAGKIRRAR